MMISVEMRVEDATWEVQVANITLDMRRNSDSPMQCKVKPIFAII
jgi:hypothetical protein